MSEKVLKVIRSSKPVRMWIDGKCFNLKQYKGAKIQHTGSLVCSSSSETSKPDIEQDELEIETEIGSNITFTTVEGKLHTSFELPQLYYIKLYQKDFLDINTISKKTNTTISVPKHNEEGKLSVTGDNKLNIIEAVSEIYSAVGQMRDSNVALQFIAIPLLSNEIQNNFNKFKTAILSQEMHGVEDSIFQSHLKLHLTVIVFVLLDSREKNEAIKALEDYISTVLKPLLEKIGPLKIHVSGIDCMNNNYEKVDVLYANAKFLNEKEDITLQNITNGISEFFYERGLLKRYQENVKLHMTLMNSKYRKDPNSPNRKRRPRRKSFDARKIMEKFKDFEFGVCDFNSIHLSKISSKGEDGFYEPLVCIKI